MAFLRPDEKQKKLIQDFQKAKAADTSLNNENESKIKPPTKQKSRLSMKLPKFKSSSSNPLKKENSFTYTSHLHQPKNSSSNSVSVPSTPMMEDVLNGNETFLREKSFPNAKPNAEKRVSRTGSFVSHSSDGEPPKPTRSSAIVPPFNYSPPSADNSQNSQNSQNSFGINSRNTVDPKKLRRNDSYVSSMGRNREELAKKKHVSATHDERDEEFEVDENGAPTSSVLVTLV